MLTSRFSIPRAARMAAALAVLATLFAAPRSTEAQRTTVTVDRVDCIPAGANAVFHATVENQQPGTTTLLFFRRLHDVVEDLYYVRMYPEGGGRFWAMMPKAEKRKLDRHEIEERRDDASRRHPVAVWWRSKEASDDRNPNHDLDQDDIREHASVGKTEHRDWMDTISDTEFDAWLASLKYEPVEYFVAVFSATGEVIARSPMITGDVRDESECHIELTPQQLGEAQNLIVGETAPWQRGKPVFHWLCDGVISRVGMDGVKRVDTSCRTCVPCINQATVLQNRRGRPVVSPSNF